MINISNLIRYDKEFSEVVSTVSKQFSELNPKPIVINGLSGGAVSAFLKESILDIRKMTHAPVLIVTSSESECERVAARLSAEGVNALHFKGRELVFHNISASRDTERERLSVLSKTVKGECDAVVATPSAALLYTMPEDMLCGFALGISVGDELSPERLTENLSALGFMRVDAVESAGQFASRGGIVDFWQNAESDPVRIEFFGDEVDRMVYFDRLTQRGVENCPHIELIPAAEAAIGDSARGRIEKAITGLISRAESEEIKSKLASELAAVKGGLPLNFRDKYLGLVYEKQENLFNYLSTYKRCAVIVLDTNGVKEDIKKRISYIENERKEMLSKGLVTEDGARYSAELSDFEKFLSENVTLHINPFSGGLGSMRVSGLFGFRCRKTVSYGDNPAMLAEDIMGFRKAMYKILLIAPNKQSAEAVMSALASSDIASRPVYNNEKFDFDTVKAGEVLVDIGNHTGFDLISPRIAVLSLLKDEGRAVMLNRKRQRILRKVGGAAARLMSYADLSPGDYVVHANYGIGLFEGMQTVTVDGITKDYITIKYAGTDKLFVPCDRLEYIGKYIGEKDKDGTVKLSKMGGSDWMRAKNKTKSAVKDIAKELINLYAERQRKPGFAFPADSDLEDEFASAFDYEETESQAVAINEIKADMMKPVPMNRLLCGDVGFGKTEVALRAAFKAIMGGKQVAILVPTTILALQHYQTTLSRMRGYPVTVEMISRFRTGKETEAILRKTKRGEVDILIGTHKLLSGKVQFRDLGLLIIDEEQRFGVAQKEKIKEAVKNVDVLTLSATPIPRTLNMAMNGISDMSILDEAPGERRPVQTYVLEHDDAVIFDAIAKELARAGQVLYLYNKVENIDLVAGKIMRALPEARVAYAHGQMEKDELEDIWQMLVRGEIDVLVCTTIIETGVDLPNANTLIIENADKMGLSQLHQIRGRVGRSARQAYAYFTYRQGKALSEIATKRLNAIREYAEFGAGFKVALRDLEIRGAGNLLGAQQHGYIDSVGYDLYVKLLSEAVLEESGRKEESFESTVDIKINANIPERYIKISSHRMEMYKKISLIECKEDMQDILDEFIDRFGNPPRETENLLKISLIRALSAKCKIKKVSLAEGMLYFAVEKAELAIWSELFAKYKGLTMRAALTPVVTYRIAKGENALDKAIEILGDYYEKSK